MKYWVSVLFVGVALFCGGRLVPRARVAKEPSPPPAETAAAPSAPSDHPGPATAGSTSVAQRAAIQTVLSRVAQRQPPAAPLAIPRSQIEASTTEPPEITQKRRAHNTAEIDERAPQLSEEKRKILLDESDRLAWDKRKFRAAFLLGNMSESEYVAVLKDDIRASLSLFEESLTDEEFTALFNRRRGSGRDPFTLGSLVGRPPNHDEPSPGTDPPAAPGKSNPPVAGKSDPPVATGKSDPPVAVGKTDPPAAGK